tara:strand:- start:848 stop:1279 length:432 start_codon:yes stop_codon:yes gene_type:complete
MIIAIGNDHAGVEFKNAIIEFFKDKNIEIKNFGTDNENSVDYPDHIHPVAEFISSKPNSYGIIICGSGNGAAMTANKHKNIRAALCWNEDLAKLSRQHNDANILSIPSRFVSLEETLKMISIFISTSFEGGRHKNRINKIPCS